jgi:hypothetical protein
MVILRGTSILGGRKEDKGMICSIPQYQKQKDLFSHSIKIPHGTAKWEEGRAVNFLSSIRTRLVLVIFNCFLSLISSILVMKFISIVMSG